MIKLNDIRHGNYLEWNKQEFVVRYIYNTCAEGELWVKPYNELHGIPLTEEWLLRLGAKKYGDKVWLPLTNLKSEFHFEIHEKEIVTSIESDFSALILDPVKYVHQLQNLYYALTGDELCVK